MSAESAAARLSGDIKTDADFRKQIAIIQRFKQRDELMMVFLNLRMEVDPDQVFRVLRLTCSLTS